MTAQASLTSCSMTIPIFCRFGTSRNSRPAPLTYRQRCRLPPRFWLCVMPMVLSWGGDRQATEGFEVSSRRMEKVYNADDYSVIAIAGAAGPCLEMVKLFQIEMEHYQKIEGEVLVLEGKANKLAQMIRQNLPAAFQGLIVIPIFAGYDLQTDEGRIYKYDITGGRYDERDFYSTGSGSREARSTLKKRFQPKMDRDAAVRLAMEALVDAADIDAGTVGPDLYRGIYPVIKIVTKDGIEDVSDDELRPMSESLLDELKG